MFLTTSAPVFYRFCSTGGAALCPAGGAHPPPAGLLGRPARNFGQMALTLPQKVCYNMARGAAPHHVRGWRNRQTRTFEGRVVIPCEFKSRPSHQVKSYILRDQNVAFSYIFIINLHLKHPIIPLVNPSTNPKLSTSSNSTV